MKCIAFIFNCGPLDILFQPRCIHKSTHAGCLFWHASLNRECVWLCCWRCAAGGDAFCPQRIRLNLLADTPTKQTTSPPSQFDFFLITSSWGSSYVDEFDGMYGCVVVWWVGLRGCKNPLNKNVHWPVELLAAPYREKSCFYRLNKSFAAFWLMPLNYILGSVSVKVQKKLELCFIPKTNFLIFWSVKPALRNCISSTLACIYGEPCFFCWFALSLLFEVTVWVQRLFLRLYFRKQPQINVRHNHSDARVNLSTRAFFPPSCTCINVRQLSGRNV